jgi:alpha/beta superfamily hydrolase
MSSPAPLPPSGRFVIPVAHGQLEAILKEPPAPVAVAVICHPHPLGGGTMNNNVVYRAAKALGEAGVAVLRFNFRGVGASTGRHDQGVGEEDDAQAALDVLAARHPALPLWMAGFSFGARVGLTVGGRDPRVSKLLGIGLALKMFDYSFLTTCP